MKLPRLPKFLSIYFIAPAIPILSRVNKEIDFSNLLETAVRNWREITRTFIHDFLDWINVIHPYKDSEIDGIFFSIFMFALSINCIRSKQVHFISSTRRLYISKSGWGRLSLLSSMSLLLASYYTIFLVWGALSEAGQDDPISVFVSVVFVTFFISFPVAMIGMFGLISPFLVNHQDELFDKYLLRRSPIKMGHVMALLFFYSTQGIIILPFIFRDMLPMNGGSEITWYIGGLLIMVVLSMCSVLLVNWKVLRKPLIWAIVIIVSDRVVMIFDPFISYVVGVIKNA